MKRIIFALAFLGLFAAVGRAELVTSTASVTNVAVKTAQTYGIVLVSCVATSSTTAGAVFIIKDGTTEKLKIAVPASTTRIINFTELFKEEWIISGILNIAALAADADARITCSIKPKKGN